MYSEGVGVGADHAKALELFRQAAADGDARAMAWLGYYHEAGLAVAQSDAEALRWYRAAAEAGDDYAAFALGDIYRDGRGVARDWHWRGAGITSPWPAAITDVEASGGCSRSQLLSYTTSDETP